MKATLTRSPLAIIPVVAIPIFLAISNQTMVSVALPAIGADLDALKLLPWLVVGYMLALTIAGPVYGVLGDSYGRTPMLIAALWVYVAGAGLCTIAPNIELLAAGRLLQGFGGGGLMSVSQALIGQLVAPRDRGRAQGYVATIGVVASTIGPVFGGVLVATLGWRSLFAFTIPLAIIAMGILIRLNLPKGMTSRQPFDIKGFVWLNAFVIAWTVGIETLKAPEGKFWAVPVGLAGAVSLILLVRSQRLSRNPLFPPRLFSITAIQRASIMVVCHGAALVSLVTIIPLFQSFVRGDTTMDVAFTLLALTMGFGASGIVTGNLITMTGYSALFPTLSLPFAAAGIAVLGIAGAELSHWELVALYIVIGLTIGSVMSVVHTTVQQSAPDDLRGRAAGAVTFFRSIGAVLGTAAVTLVLFALAPHSDSAGANIGAILTNSGEGLPVESDGWNAAFRASFLTVAAFVAGAWIMAATTPARRVA